MLETLSSILGLSFVSGINLYAAVLTVGLGIRYGWLTGIPPELHVLSHPVILGIAAAMYVAEFIADKVPFFTPIWDAIHTFIRPLGAAMLAMQAAGKLSPQMQVVAALAGGTIALGTHSTKAAARLLAHVSPEPASHSAISIAEDFGVVALLALVYSHPEIAVPVIVVMLIAVSFFLPALLRVLRFIVSGIAGRITSFVRSADSSDIAEWAMLDGTTGFRCFVRAGPRLSRLKEVYLLKKGSQFLRVERKLFRPVNESLMVSSALVNSGMIYDVVTIKNGNAEQTFYVTKEWAAECRKMCQEQTFAGVAPAVSKIG